MPPGGCRITSHRQSLYYSRTNELQSAGRWWSQPCAPDPIRVFNTAMRVPPPLISDEIALLALRAAAILLELEFGSAPLLWSSLKRYRNSRRSRLIRHARPSIPIARPHHHLRVNCRPVPAAVNATA